MPGIPQSRVHLLAYTFAPTVACIIAGQISALVLLGVCLFVRYQETRPFLAGLGVALMAIKPHLFLPFWPVFLLWAIYRKRYSSLVGLVLVLAVLSGLSMSFDRHIWFHYYAYLSQTGGIEREFIPTLSGIVRLIAAPRLEWAQFLPASVATILIFAWFLRGRRTWRWEEKLNGILLVGLIFAPYAWFFDEVVILPAILAVFYLELRHEARARISVFVYFLLNVVCIVMLLSQIPLTSGAYFWTPAAWALWYVFTKLEIEKGKTGSADSVRILDTSKAV